MKIDKIRCVPVTLANIEAGELFEMGGCYYIRTDSYADVGRIRVVNIETGELQVEDMRSNVYSVTYNLEVNIDE